MIISTHSQGPYVEEKMRTEVEIIEPENFYIRAAVQAMRNRGVVVSDIYLYPRHD